MCVTLYLKELDLHMQLASPETGGWDSSWPTGCVIWLLGRPLCQPVWQILMSFPRWCVTLGRLGALFEGHRQNIHFCLNAVRFCFSLSAVTLKWAVLSARSKTNLTFQWNKVLQHRIINALRLPAWNSLASIVWDFVCLLFFFISECCYEIDEHEASKPILHSF